MCVVQLEQKEQEAKINCCISQLTINDILSDCSSDDLFERQITWDIIPWIKSFTKLPVVIKGILTAEDARLAVQHGADAIVVSNHGGRQLDGVLATVSI